MMSPWKGRLFLRKRASVRVILTARLVLAMREEAAWPSSIDAVPVRWRTFEVLKSGMAIPTRGLTFKFPSVWYNLFPESVLALASTP